MGFPSVETLFGRSKLAESSLAVHRRELCNCQIVSIICRRGLRRRFIVGTSAGYDMLTERRTRMCGRLFSGRDGRSLDWKRDKTLPAARWVVGPSRQRGKPSAQSRIFDIDRHRSHLFLQSGDRNQRVVALKLTQESNSQRKPTQMRTKRTSLGVLRSHRRSHHYRVSSPIIAVVLKANEQNG